jgi:hypothetical protein
MTDGTTSEAPSFRAHSHVLATLRALFLVALCAAITAAFLAQVWRAPQPREAGAPAAPAIAQRAP